MKYPLTEDAKATALALVAAWDLGELEQQALVGVSERVVNNRRRSFISIHDEELLPSTLRELSLFGLLVIEKRQGASYNLLLLQELRNAVATDFEVSDYFVTMNAVGNIIVNSTTGPVQGVGINMGAVHQTLEQLSDSLTTTLGVNLLETQRDLRTAVEELKTATAADRESKLGSVISELGRCLQHGANTVTILSGLSMVASFIAQLPKQDM